jgi:hypothetical protein
LQINSDVSVVAVGQMPDIFRLATQTLAADSDSAPVSDKHDSNQRSESHSLPAYGPEVTANAVRVGRTNPTPVLGR